MRAGLGNSVVRAAATLKLFSKQGEESTDLGGRFFYSSQYPSYPRHRFPVVWATAGILISPLCWVRVVRCWGVLQGQPLWGEGTAGSHWRAAGGASVKWVE